MPFPNQAPAGAAPAASAAPAMPPAAPPAEPPPQADDMQDNEFANELMARVGLLDPQERQALMAPEVMGALGKILPELADALGGAEPSDQGGEDMQEPAGPTGPQYSMPRPATRLGQM